MSVATLKAAPSLLHVEIGREERRGKWFGEKFCDQDVSDAGKKRRITCNFVCLHGHVRMEGALRLEENMDADIE